MTNLAYKNADIPGPDNARIKPTASDVNTIEEILYSISGVKLGASRESMVYSRLIKRLNALGLEQFRDYCALVGDKGNEEERRIMVDALTTNHTHFFREPHHFEHMRTVSLPPLLESARNGARVRLWCAGCSSGEEAFCMAFTILSLMPDAASYDIKILATDIDTTILEKARAGLYPERMLSKVPDDVRSRWFNPVAGSYENNYEVSPAVHELIAFRQLNLLSQWPMKGQFQIIFCRNVTIYFDEETKSELWQRFAAIMPVGGIIYIGHSEHLSGSAKNDFTNIATTTFEKQ